MAHRLERLRGAVRARPRLAALLALAAVGVVATLFFLRAPSSGAAEAVEKTHVVRKAPFVQVKGFRGEITPGESIAVLAPFDGTVTSLDFAYGDQVEAGQPLAALDLGDVRRSRNDAEGAYLRASQDAAEVRNWQNGPEMARARRNLTSATLDLRQTERRAQETKGLFDRGLVPRLEYENMLQQLRSQQMSVEAAELDLRETERRGQGAYQRMASLELASAADRLQQLNKDVGGSVIVAPEAGIIVLPPTTTAADAEQGVRVGARVAKGQPLGVIARQGGLAVRFQLDESDVNAVKVGQPLMVMGPGFQGVTLNGRIVSISGQASSEGGRGGKATFQAVGRLDPLKPAQARRVRIGMSANIRVLTYVNMKALSVPPEAVQGRRSSASVMVRDAGGGPVRKVKVRVGEASPSRVEILSGLKAGDTVVWTRERKAPSRKRSAGGRARDVSAEPDDDE